MDSPNYFDLFKISPAFFLDLDLLQKKFYELTRTLHPDRFQTQSDEAIAKATQSTAILNKAFTSLKDPERRAEYLFELANFTLGKGVGTLPPTLAEDYFAIQEAIEEGDFSSSQVKEQLATFSILVKKEIVNLDSARDEAFRQWEKAHFPLDRSADEFFKKAATAIQQKSYLLSMIQDLEKKWPA